MTNDEFIESVKKVAEQYSNLYNDIVIDRKHQIISIGEIFFAQSEEAEILFDDLAFCPEDLDKKLYLLWYLDGAGIFNQ